MTFDGCRESDGTMLEAKGPTYAKLLANIGKWANVNAYDDAMEQAKKQITAAGARQIEWYFAEKSAADFFADKFREEGFREISVIYTEPSDDQ